MNIINFMAQIDRKTASRLLKVSIRTVDRYIRSNKLYIEQRDGRIWLNKSQVLKLRNSKESRQSVDAVDTEMSIDKEVSTPVDMSMDSVHIVSTSDDEEKPAKRANTARANDESAPLIYKKLFEELQSELRTKQERLEGANYRVGHLEALLKDAIPLPEHNRLLLSERTDKQKLEGDFASLSQEAEYLAERLKDEKFTKKIFLIFLFIIMLLQPLWLLVSLWK